MIVVLVGPPGSGKGTQCKRLADRFSLAHLSSGDIFRAEIRNSTELGAKVKAFIERGDLVPDELVIDMMKGAVAEKNYNCILDGFPRTLSQAEQLDIALNADNKKIALVIELTVDDNVVADRISRRRVCPSCGAVYHLETIVPAVEGKCDQCGANIIHRDDDRQEVVLDRLKTYHSQTSPIIGYYRNSDTTFRTVDASLPIDEITEAISREIEEIESNV
ncbi:MAG: adenylate kinase [Phycisphaerae bacterium]|jgi:adenylate kinase